MVYATFCHLQVIILKSLQRAKYKNARVSCCGAENSLKNLRVVLCKTQIDSILVYLSESFNGFFDTVVHMYVPNKIEIKFDFLFQQHSIFTLNFILFCKYQFLIYSYIFLLISCAELISRNKYFKNEFLFR